MKLRPDLRARLYSACLLDPDALRRVYEDCARTEPEATLAFVRELAQDEARGFAARELLRRLGYRPSLRPPTPAPFSLPTNPNPKPTPQEPTPKPRVGLSLVSVRRVPTGPGGVA
jgi:hypothetical protein